jgi:acetyl-CoA carboxylase biotin carboxyl carrier protein
MSDTPAEAAMDGIGDAVAVGPGDGSAPEARNGTSGIDGAGGAPRPTDATASADPTIATGPDASLLALVDRLAGVLERSDLGELEVSAGGTTIVLRAPAALERAVAVGGPAAPEPSAQPAAGTGATAEVSAPPAAARPSVKAPLTGIYYSAPSPGATPYVQVGDQVGVGQLIGLIEAMKLFNEIKSDLAGRVVKVCADNGSLVKAKQPLIEVEAL